MSEANNSGKKRLTAHNGRKGKDGVYSPLHNSRNFDLENAPHIDPTKTSDNKYFYLGIDYGNNFDYDGFTIKDHEFNFYKKHFQKDLDHKNINPIKNRQYSRVKTMEQYISSPKTCPEETIFQIGKRNEKGNAEGEMLLSMVGEFISWHQEKYPLAVFLDVALHVDEPRTAHHIQMRKEWIAHEDGREIVNQGKSLEEMGVEALFYDDKDKRKNKTRYNNAKITYTRDCREKLIEIAKSYGFDIEEEPLEASKTGLELLEFKRREEEKRIEELRREAEGLIETIAVLKDIAIDSAKPERTGLFGRKKTGNIVMPEDKYSWLVHNSEIISEGVNKLIENAKYTEEYKEAASKNYKKSERSVMRVEEEIREEVQRRFEESHGTQIQETEEAKRNRDETDKILKNVRGIVKKKLSTMDNDMKKFMENHKLDDGRNALKAFEQAKVASIQRRLRETMAGNMDYIKKDEEEWFGKG